MINKLTKVAQEDQPDEGWQLEGDKLREIFIRLMSLGTSLQTLVGEAVYRGVLTGLNDAFYIDTDLRNHLIATDPKCDAYIKP